MLQKKIVSHLVLTAILALTAGQAAKADDWSGFYVGVAGGPQFDKSKIAASSVGPANVFGVDPTTAQAKLDASHGRIGGYLGWQMPVAPGTLAGVEADVYGILDATSSKPYLPGASYNGTTSADQVSTSSGYDASVRARLATEVYSDISVYGTAGVAFRDLDTKANCPGGTGSWCGSAESASFTKTLVGWTAGVGVESKLTAQWTVRLEYRYADYGNTNVAFFTGTNYGADQTSNKVDLTSQIITVGVAYHFGM